VIRVFIEGIEKPFHYDNPSDALAAIEYLYGTESKAITVKRFNHIARMYTHVRTVFWNGHAECFIETWNGNYYA